MSGTFSASEKRIITYIFIAVMIVLFIISAIVLINRNNEEKFSINDYRKTTYCVKSGDTLWEIGSMYKKADDDVRDWIKAVKDINSLTSSSIIANEYITILVPKN